MESIVKESQNWLNKKAQILSIKAIACFGSLLAAFYVGNVIDNYLASSILLGISGAAGAGLLGFKKDLRMHEFIAKSGSNE